MSAVVIDASAGAEIVANTRRGRALSQLPFGVEGWVPEHFYAEVLSVIRRRLLIEKTITETDATAAVSRLRSWHLHHAAIHPLVDVAWAPPAEEAAGRRGLRAEGAQLEVLGLEGRGPHHQC